MDHYQPGKSTSGALPLKALLSQCFVALILLSMAPWSAIGCGHHLVSHNVAQHAEMHMLHKGMLQNLRPGIGSHADRARRMAATSEAPRVHSSRIVDHSHHQEHRSLSSSANALDPTARHQVSSDIFDLVVNQSAKSSILYSSSGGSQGSTQPQPAPLRMYVEYQQVSQANTQLLRQIVQAATQILATHLKVRNPVSGSLLVSPLCTSYQGETCTKWHPDFSSPSSDQATCGLANINPAHVLNYDSCTPASNSSSGSDTIYDCLSYSGAEQGQATDFYLYVTAVQNSDCFSGAAAWAQPCMYDLQTNRPVMGAANICPFALQSTDTEKLVAVVTHELLHALGFTNSLFPIYIDPATNARLATSNVVRSAVVGGKQVLRVVSPTVAREARLQFNCSTLDGAQLENEGGDGSAGSHWEYSHYQGEVMVSSMLFAASGEPPRLSRLTLALMEDSGWYLANWTAVTTQLPWARNTGCVLPTQGCAQYSSQQSLAASASAAVAPLFCDPVQSAGQQICGPTLRSVGSCKALNFSDGCGMTLARGSVPTCLFSQYQYESGDVFGWAAGSSSRCFPVVYKWAASGLMFPDTGNQGDTDSICFRSSCDSAGKLYVSLFGQSFACPSGQLLNLAKLLPDRFSQGLLGPCPDNALTCSTLQCAPGSCSSQGGMCDGGKCVCKIGYSGPDCSFSLLTGQALAPDTSATTNAPPPPPQAQNVSHWVQVLKGSLQISTASSASLTGAVPQLNSILARWAGVQASQIVVLWAGSPNSTTSSSSSGGAASSLASSGRHLKQQGHQSFDQVTNAAAASKMHKLRGENSRHLLPRLLGTASSTVLQVTWQAILRNTTQTEHLVALLTPTASSGAAAGEADLSAALAAAGVGSLVPETLSLIGLTAELIYELEFPSSAADGSIAAANKLVTDSIDSGKSRTTLIIYIACAVGGVVGLVAIVVGIVVACKSRVYEDKAAAAARRQRRHGSAGGGSSAGGAGYGSSAGGASSTGAAGYGSSAGGASTSGGGSSVGKPEKVGAEILLTIPADATMPLPPLPHPADRGSVDRGNGSNQQQGQAAAYAMPVGSPANPNYYPQVPSWTPQAPVPANPTQKH